MGAREQEDGEGRAIIPEVMNMEQTGSLHRLRRVEGCWNKEVTHE